MQILQSPLFPDTLLHGETSVDYPDFAVRVAGKVSAVQFKRGILICDTGIGMSMAANRFPYVRAALRNDLFSRHHESVAQ